MRKIVYHYCSVDAFINIINNKTLRFSDIMKSNDSKEIEFLWEKYFEYALSVASNKEYAKIVLRHFKDEQLKNNVFLALCLSKKDNDLHMWNCYANEGVSIGFNYEKLLKWKKRICYFNPNSEYPNNMGCVEVKSVSYFNLHNVAEFVKNKCKIIRTTLDGLAPVFYNAPFCKSDFFKSEKEVRALIKIWMHENNSNKLEYSPKKNGESQTIKLGTYSNRYSKIVPFVDIPFPEEMVETIMIGPNCNLKEKDVRELLFVNEFENYWSIDIQKSEGTYR